MSDQLDGSSQPAFIHIGLGQKHPLWAKLPSHDEGMTALYDRGKVTLFLILHDWSETDTSAFRGSGLKFGLLPMRGGYTWLLWTGMCVFDMPYTPWLEAPENREPPWSQGGLGAETRLLIDIHALDRTGAVRGLKATTVSPHFTRALAQAHRRAIAEGQDAAKTWDAEVQRYNARYRTPNDALKHAVATSKGGD